MPYKFSMVNSRDCSEAGVCAMCGNRFSKDWSYGGVGKVCETCFDKRYNLDLVMAGLIRNIVLISDKNYSKGYSFTAEACIDGH